MDFAYTLEKQLIQAKNAVSGLKYYCPYCRCQVIFYPGKVMVSHFRHMKGEKNYSKELCELYSNSLSIDNVYNLETVANQGVRLIIERNSKDYKFFLKFPLINKEITLNQIQKSYYSYSCREIVDFEFNIVNLLPSRNNNVIEVPLLNKYTLTSSNLEKENNLDLKISGGFLPFENRSLIFKEIQGRFTSIPYQKITLSDRFFVVTKYNLSIHESLDVISYLKYSVYHIYDLIMPTEFSEDLIEWFGRTLDYELTQVRCHIDLIKPSNFKKIGTTYEVSEPFVELQISNIKVSTFNQKIIVISPDSSISELFGNKNNVVEINFSRQGDYIIYMDQVVTEFITLRYLPEVVHSNKSLFSIKINDNEVIYKKREIVCKDVCSVSSTHSFCVSSKDEIDYKVNTNDLSGLKAPFRIDIPTIWSLKITKQNIKKNIWDYEKLLSYYERVNMFPKGIYSIQELISLKQMVIDSNYKNKRKLLYLINYNGFQIPKPVIDYIRELKEDK
ncbi:hypothetical protein [Sporosarcina ureae]|uniref:competence protein CoiA family protein n=1 Tax=Sporosarcina ureae TaxID=1571 RepID=UPI0026EF2327|nr:hypothetical protein [Sporosarcina ureae]